MVSVLEGAVPPSARPGVNVASTLHRAARLQARRTAVVDGDTTYDYATFLQRVAGLGGGLRGLGLERGAVVGVLALNSHRHLECWLGVPRAGFVLNELNTRLSLAELTFIVDDSEAIALVVDDAHLDLGRALLAACPRVVHLVHASAAPAADLIDFEGLVASAPCEAAPTDADDAAGIFYTGGTTGRPKGVVLTHGNLLANAEHVLIGLGFRTEDRYLHAGPMFHLADGASTYGLTWVGGTHVIVPAFSPALVAATIAAERVTATILVPTMINLLVNDPDTADVALGSLRVVYFGGSPMPAGVLQQARARLGCDLVQLYGMTEAAPIATVCWIDGDPAAEPWRSRLRSAGVPIVGVEVGVRRGDGSEADVDEVGEVWVRGQNVMAGYWRRPEETAAAITADGWYRSGDAGRFDADGYLYIVDRLKEMIVSGGENVYCAEVESALSSHPAVLEVAVFGVPDERWGERVHAAVVARPGTPVSDRELIDHCRAQIAGYKVPRSIELRSEPLPKSGAGKVLKRELRAPHWAGRDAAIS